MSQRFSLFFLSGVLSLLITGQSIEAKSMCVQEDFKHNKLIGQTVHDQLMPATSVNIQGFAGEKLDASYQNRILAQDIDRLVEPFTTKDEHHCWQGEFWGKWFTSAVLAYRYNPTPELEKKLKHAVYALIETQTPEGYIGNYAPESRLQAWDIWGRKYCLLGLIAYYDISNDQKVLDAAKKQADFLIGELEEKNAPIVKMGNHRGMAASSVLEPMCQLYKRTDNRKYLDFAEEIVRQWETADGPQLISKADTPVGQRFPKPDSRNWYGWDQGQKAYEMMSCYEGLLELYRLTGNESYREAAEQTWQSIQDTEINIAGSGSAMEAWFSGKELQTAPVAHYQETCVTVTWLKFNQQMLRLTGEAKYADAIEQTFYNALLGSMRPDGSDWAKYTPLQGQRLEGSEQCGMGLNCCNASGPRGLFTMPATVTMSSPKGLFVNFYMEGSYTLETPAGREVTLHQKTDYPRTGLIEIELNLREEEEMEISLRIPAWCDGSTIRAGGTTITNATPGEYFMIDRKWKKGDKIEIEFEMNGKIHSTLSHPSYMAITRGPILLARDERLNGPALEAILTPVVKEDKTIDLTLKDRGDGNFWMTFSARFIPESYTEGGAEPVESELCDYASAGNSGSEAPFFKVWLPQLIDPRK